MAIVLEHNSSKTCILEAYVNSVYFGHGTFGVSAAAQHYFNKPVQTLSLAEAATLVAVLPSPEHFSPLHNPALALQRQRLVLRLMYAAGYVDESTRDAALAAALPLSLARAPRGRCKSLHAPHLSGAGAHALTLSHMSCDLVG